MAGIISLDWPGKVVVGLEQCWWSWRISGLVRVVWESYTGPGSSGVMCDGSEGLECCDRRGVARIGLSGP